MPSLRWSNGFGYKKQKKFFNAIEKYGWNNFEHIILKSNISKYKAAKIESELIDKYDSIKNGYNIAKGGFGNTSCKTNKWKEQHSKRMSGSGNSFYGKHLTEEHKKKISINHADINGSNNPNYGKHASFKNKEATKNKNSKQVIWIDVNIIFDSAIECSIQTGISVSSIRKCASGK